MLLSLILALFGLINLSCIDSASGPCSAIKTIQNGLDSCAVTDFDVFKEQEKQDTTWKTWVRVFAQAAVSTPGGIAGGPGTLGPSTRVVGFGINALIAGAAATEKKSDPNSLNLLFQDAVEEEFNKMRGCIDQKINLNNANEDRKTLIGQIKKYQGLKKKTSITAFNDDIKDVFSRTGDFITENFYTGTKSRPNFYEASIYLPLWASTFIFYDSMSQSYLKTLGCDIIDKVEKSSRRVKWEERCKTYNDERAELLKHANYLNDWIQYVFPVIYSAYFPNSNQEKISILIPGPNTPVPLNKVCQKGSCDYDTSNLDERLADDRNGLTGFTYESNGIKYMGGTTSLDMDNSDTFATTLYFQAGEPKKKKTITCDAGSVHCSSTKVRKHVWGPWFEYYETPNAQCCESMKNVCVNKFIQVSQAVHDWAQGFKIKYLKKANAFMKNYKSIPASCTSVTACDGPTPPPTPKPTPQPPIHFNPVVPSRPNIVQFKG